MEVEARQKFLFFTMRFSLRKIFLTESPSSKRSKAKNCLRIMLRLAFRSSHHKRVLLCHVLWKKQCYCKSRKSFLQGCFSSFAHENNICSTNFKFIVIIIIIIIIQQKSSKIVFSLHCRFPSLRILLRLLVFRKRRRIIP